MAQTDSRFVKLADFMLKRDEGLYAGDPCYIDLFVNRHLDDTADHSDLLAGLAIWGWDKSVLMATVFGVVDEDGTRALVLTINAEPPRELLEDILKGTYYITSFVGVDSGQVGFYGDDYLDNEENSPTKNQKTANNGYYAFTYIGDGVYPIAVWAIDGKPHTFAILTDYAYFDPAWQI